MRLNAMNLHAGYGGVPALHGISMEIQSGEIVALVGRNGVGKTTLVKTLMGLLPVTDGELLLDDQPITNWAPSKRVRAGLRATFQEKGLFQELTVGENLRLNGFEPNAQDAVLAQFPKSLSGRQSQRAGTLSGGEQKMLAAACALKTDASLIIMDEPTEGLQPSNVEVLGDHIDNARSAGRGVLLIEQHIALANRLADRFIVVEKGRVVEASPADDPTIQTRIKKRLAI